MSEPIDVEFVNRDEELKIIRKMRLGDSQAPRILLVKAPKGMGKTWLLRQAQREHRDLQVGFLSLSHKVPFAADPIVFVQNLSKQIRGVDWAEVNEILQQAGEVKVVVQRDGRDKPQVSRRGIMRLLDRFRGVFAQLERESPPAEITFGDQAHIQGDVFTGNKYEFNLNAPDDPNDRELGILLTGLSDAFIRALGVFTRSTPALLLLDDYGDRPTVTEPITEPITEKWLLNAFLPSIRDGTLDGVLVVIAGEKVPEFDRDWKNVAKATELGNFPEPVVTELWTERYGRPEKEIEYAMSFSRGIPHLLAQMADNAEAS